MKMNKTRDAWKNAERAKSFHGTGRLTKTSGQNWPGTELESRGGALRNRSLMFWTSCGQKGVHSTVNRGTGTFSFAENRSYWRAVARCCILLVAYFRYWAC